MTDQALNQQERETFLGSGAFQIGCNYWESQKGIAMWREFDAESINADFKRLASVGMRLIRLFPLWPDFQPIDLLRGCRGEAVEYRFGEKPLPATEAGQAGVSEEMMRRFRKVADLAEAWGLKLIVSMVTGWMSGRLFVPRAFANRNVLTDPEVLIWQARLVRYFVLTMRDHRAIAAWEFGNECNCMGTATRAEAWVWMNNLAATIRAADATRPIASGMHNPVADTRQAWSVPDQAELTDFLTTHPYPIFTPHCDLDPLDSMRGHLHGTTESLFYRGIGQKPCFVEEMGSIGSMLITDRLVPSLVRPALFSLWAHDLRALVWWCGFDYARGSLEEAPYDWCLIESNLGLFRHDGSARPVTKTFSDFAALMEGLPSDFKPLPPRTVDGVCVLTGEQDQWGAALGSMLLSKWAGADIEFQMCEQPLRPSNVYLVPCLNGNNSISRRTWLQLLEKAKAGATLYLSLDHGMVDDLEEIVGVEVLSRERVSLDCAFRLHDGTDVVIPADFRYVLQATHATVLGKDAKDVPVYVRAPYGKGHIFLLTVPLETKTALQPSATLSSACAAARGLYRDIFASQPTSRVFRISAQGVTLTEHVVSPGSRSVIVINHNSTPAEAQFQLDADWQIATVPYGRLDGSRLLLGGCDAACLNLRRGNTHPEVI